MSLKTDVLEENRMRNNDSVYVRHSKASLYDVNLIKFTAVVNTCL